MRLLGIDFGQKRIGLAISDPLGLTAQPLEVLQNGPLVFKKISDICKEKQVSKIIVGLPKTLKGELSYSAHKVALFITKLKKEIKDVEVILQDERFSTAGAEKSLSLSNFSGQKKRSIIDKLAAAYILQGYLDAFKKNK